MNAHQTTTSRWLIPSPFNKVGTILGSITLAAATIASQASAASLNFVTPRNLGAMVNSASSELGPTLSADGLTLIFHSDRAGGSGGNDLWLATRMDLCEPFGSSTNLGATINSGAHEVGADLSPNGLELFFSSSRPGGSGNYDLYVARRTSTSDPFGAPINLGANVNTANAEFSPALSSNGLDVYFQRRNDPGGLGGDDIWVASRSSLSNPLGPAANLGSNVNSASFEGGPDISDDGLALFFTSNRSGGLGGLDIWVSTRGSVEEPFGTTINLSAVNSSASDFNSNIAIDGHYYQSDRSGGEGGNDLWFAPFLQVVDPRYVPMVPNPLYPGGDGPIVLVDSGHENFQTIEGRYKPFADLLRADGYRVIDSPHLLTDPEFRSNLDQAEIFVMALAKTVLNAEEVTVLVEWIANGGSLLFIFDHPPYSDAVLDLAAALGIEILNDAFVVIPPTIEPISSVFDRVAGDIKSHFVTDGRIPSETIHQVRTGAGYAFTKKEPMPVSARMEPILVFGSEAYFQLNGIPRESAAGTYQGAVLSFGQGRVYAASDGAHFTAQIVYGCPYGFQWIEDNEQFVLNILHWLDGHSTRLEIARSNPNRLTLSWYGEAYDLEMTPSLSIPQWSLASDNRTNPVVIPAVDPEQYFRLQPALPLLITEQPQSQMVATGEVVSFSVTATGTGPLRYQWRSNWVDMVGATNSSILLPSVTPEQRGEFQVVVSDNFGSITSAPASLVIEDLVWIPAGSFTMGSPATEVERLSREGPQTGVTISQGFWMGRHEVTQREFIKIMGFNPSWFNGARATNDSGTYGLDLSRPVERVTWFDATNYCDALTERQRLLGRLPDGYTYRLPTEAEWEYACRAGTSTAFHYGPELRSGMANFDGGLEYESTLGTITNETGIHLRITVTVGSYAPNAWGLHDMHGNVWEWCHDWYSTSLPGVAVTDPTGALSGPGRVDRGGSYFYGARYSRSAYRGWLEPEKRGSGLGFRVVLGRPLP